MFEKPFEVEETKKRPLFIEKNHSLDVAYLSVIIMTILKVNLIFFVRTTNIIV